MGHGGSYGVGVVVGDFLYASWKRGKDDSLGKGKGAMVSMGVYNWDPAHVIVSSEIYFPRGNLRESRPRKNHYVNEKYTS